MIIGLLSLCMMTQLLVPALAADSLGALTETDWVQFFLEEDLQTPDPIASITVDAGSVTFSYDKNNNRVRKEFGKELTTFTYDTNNCLSQEQSSKRTIHYLYENVYGQYVCIGITYCGENYFFQYDEFGNVQYILNADLEMICKYEYLGSRAICSEYSNGAWVENNQAGFIGNINPIRYQAWYYDRETDCYYIGSGMYYDIENNSYIKNDYTLRHGDVMSRSMSPYSLIYAQASTMAIDYLNSDSHNQLYAQVLSAEWNSGKRWFDGVSAVTVAARCIYAENYHAAANDDRIAIMRVIANRINNGSIGANLFDVVTYTGQFTTINPNSWASNACPTARAAKSPADAVWKQATLLSCLVSLSTDTEVTLGAAVGGWPAGIDSQMNFFGLDRVYTTSQNYSIKNGVLYNGSKPMSNVAVAGVGKLTIPSSGTVRSLLGSYYGGNRYNLFFTF